MQIEKPESGGGKFAVLKLARAPVNSLNTELIKQITGAIDTLEKVLTSLFIILAPSLDPSCARVKNFVFDLMFALKSCTGPTGTVPPFSPHSLIFRP